MRILKQGLFSLLINLRSFFYLSYPMLQALCGLGIAIGLLLSSTPSNVREHGYLVVLTFTGLAMYLFCLKHYYQNALAWSDTRSANIVAIKFK